MFEYDTTGPNPSARKAELSVTSEQFMVATAGLGELPFDGMRLELRTQESRVGVGAYMFVNDAGEAWSPGGEDEPVKHGHITHDRDAVLAAYDMHLAAFDEKFYGLG